MKHLTIRTLATGVAAISITGCLQPESRFTPITRQQTNKSQVDPNVAELTASATLRIEDGAGEVKESMIVERGAIYKACVTSPNSTTSVILKLNGATFASGASNQCFELDLRSSNAGNFPLTVTSTAPGMKTGNQSHTLAVTCTSAEVAGKSASQFVSGVSVALANGVDANVYSYTLSGSNLAGADCALDFNGDGILDGQYQPCTQAQVNYSNHIGARNLYVEVRDKTCNWAFPTTLSANFPAATQSDPNFLQAKVTQTDAKAKSPRLNLNHLSTNKDGYRIVNCNYSSNDQGQNGVATITADRQYEIRRNGEGHHGINIAFNGLTGKVEDGNVQTLAGTTKMSGLTFSTDKPNDGSLTQLTFTGTASNCTGTLNVENIEIEGQPCDPEKSGTVRLKTLLLTGSFSCSGLAAGGHQISVTEGKFACSWAPVDNCLPGGDSGGTPPSPY